MTLTLDDNNTPDARFARNLIAQRQMTKIHLLGTHIAEREGYGDVPGRETIAWHL